MGAFNAIYGGGNSGYGVQILSASVFTYSDLSKQTITGGSGDVLVGGTAKSWGSLPFINTGNNATAVQRA